MVRIASVTISDRASAGVYEDKSGPAIAAWLDAAVSSDYELLSRIVPDGVTAFALE